MSFLRRLGWMLLLLVLTPAIVVCWVYVCVGVLLGEFEPYIRGWKVGVERVES